jgi:hypothetical protein
MIELSVGDVTAGLARAVAAEIDKPPFFDCSRKPHITCERYTMDMKHVLNTNRKLSCEKCQQSTNMKSGSGYSLKIFSTLGGASVAADAFFTRLTRKR